MKLIITIPAYNEEENIGQVIREIPRQIKGVSEVQILVVDDGSIDRTAQVAKAAGADYVYTNSVNQGLAFTFKRALWLALVRGADVIVNTDADNHYDQSRISELTVPVIAGQYDIAIGSRKVHELEQMPFWNKHLNRLGSMVLTKWLGLPKFDVSTGFRAYSREAALKLGIYSQHTYVHTTLFSAQDLHLSMIEIPIKARTVTRRSRLIKNIPSHLWKASLNILRNVVLFRPFRFFGIVAVIFFALGIIPIARFLYFVVTEGGRGHIQSLVLAGVLVILGFNSFMLGLLGSSIGWTRKLNEEILYFAKKQELDRLSGISIEGEKKLKECNTTNEGIPHNSPNNEVYSTHDKIAIKERLRSLGYLD